MGKHVQCGGFGAAIVNRYLRQDIVRTSLEVLDENIPVAILIEHAGVDQFEFVIVQAAIAIFLYQPAVWVGSLRVLIKHLQVGMVGRSVKIIVVLLDILSVIALAVGQAEKPLLQDRVLSVP